MRGVRIYAATPRFHNQPRRFYDVFRFCYQAQVRLMVVVTREEWEHGGWREAFERRMPPDTMVIHSTPPLSPDNPPAFMVTGARGGRFTSSGYALQLGYGFPATEAELDAVASAVERQSIARISELHVYPADALLRNPNGRLPSHLHGWPPVVPDLLFPPGSQLSLTALASRIASIEPEAC
jgi:hypothetical protein